MISSTLPLVGGVGPAGGSMGGLSVGFVVGLSVGSMGGLSVVSTGGLLVVLPLWGDRVKFSNTLRCDGTI